MIPVLGIKLAAFEYRLSEGEDTVAQTVRFLELLEAFGKMRFDSGYRMGVKTANGWWQDFGEAYPERVSTYP